jgi:hypothetical protein
MNFEKTIERQKKLLEWFELERRGASYLSTKELIQHLELDLDVVTFGDSDDSDETLGVELLPCPFCGSDDLDEEFWAGASTSGPGCNCCGATAESKKVWNERVITPIKVDWFPCTDNGCGAIKEFLAFCQKELAKQFSCL